MTQALGRPSKPTHEYKARCKKYTRPALLPIHPAVFLFFYFLFLFFKKYIFDLEIYRNIPGRPAARRPGPGGPAAGAYLKKSSQKIAPRSLEDRPPGSGAASPPGRPAAGRRALAARLQGDRSPQPYIRCWLPLNPSFASLKIQKKEKKREGGRGEGEAKRRSPIEFSSR